ncbi:MAG: sigma-54-dependent transcriptional regulator [Thermodesulfobacteriota bacterium]
MEDKEVLLIVDDEPDMASLIKRAVSSETKWHVMTADSAKEALNIMQGRTVHVVLLDIKMPGMDGIELLEIIKRQVNSPTVVMMTAYGVIETAVEAIRKGAYDFITKPFDNTRLILTLKKAMERHFLISENRSLQRLVKSRNVFQQMVGMSNRMKNVFDTIQMVSKTDATVLITGESGTGKELVARAIHRLSDRSDKRFVIVNCPALPGSILETELFGYVRGAFTDAKQDRQGLFREADGGTIVLDEIGDLPINFQTKLLRVLQEKEIKPLGHPRSATVDVRVLASTNRNLKELMAKGEFREDLYYRLNVVSIEVPPLRERPEDIPLLVEHFFRKYSKKFGKEDLGLGPDFMSAMCSNPWNGNVRELENVIERAIIMTKGRSVRFSELDMENQENRFLQCPPSSLPYRQAKEEMLNRFNLEYLTGVLGEFRGNVTHAARRCGLQRQSFQQLLRRYGIKAEEYRTRN